MGLNIWEGKKVDLALEAIKEVNEGIVTGLNNVTLALMGMYDSDSEGIYFRNYWALQMLNRMGLAHKILDSYSVIYVDRIASMSVTVHGTGVTAATVDPAIFAGIIGMVETKDYEFMYDGSAWRFEGKTVSLDHYGITATGTAAEDDTIVVHETSTSAAYDILDLDHDVPSDENLEHTITLSPREVENYNVLAYKKPQGIFWVDPATFPNGLTAGTQYYITVNHGAYDLSTAEDGNYAFTPTVNVPADGLVRHTTMGAWVSGSAYSKTHILNGTFTTYGTRANGRQVIESGLTTMESSDGVYLGTTTGEDVTLRSAKYINFTRRNYAGSSNSIDSDQRQWFRSSAPAGVKANGDMKWHEFATVFDLPASYNAPGYLYGLDPALVAVIGPVRKRTFLPPQDRADQSVIYVDSDETVFALSMNECGLGTTNGGVYENAVNRDGTVKTTAYAYWARRTTAAERVKYQGATARHWWLRSPLPSGCSIVRVVISSGVLYDHYAGNAFGAVPAFNIV